MKKYFMCAVAAVCLTPLLARAQDTPTKGAFAMQLAPALKLGRPATEAEAQEMLKSVGIAPKGGWNSDYPITPIELGQLRDSLLLAVGAGKLSMSSDQALNAFSDAAGILPSDAPQIVNNYYYPPQMGYADPYLWYPYPFYGYGGFPGFYSYGGFAFRNGRHGFKFNQGLRPTFGFNFSSARIWNLPNSSARIWNLPTPRATTLFSIRTFNNRGFGNQSFTRFRGGFRGGAMMHSGGFRSGGSGGGMRSGGHR